MFNNLNYNILDANVHQHRIWQNYGFLWRESGEIMMHQLIFDPIQDTLFKKIFEFSVQYGHSPREVNLKPEGGMHALMHIYLGGEIAHSVKGLMIEYLIHAGIKAIATIIFPIIHSFRSFSNLSSEMQYNGEQIIKFFGITPLEAVNSFKALSDQILGSDNIIANNIEYWSFRRNHHKDRAEDPEFENFMNDYNIWMETIDAALHAYDDISVLTGNLHLSSIDLKMKLWLRAKLWLYENTNAENEVHDQKIQYLRGEINHNENSNNLWQDNLDYLKNALNSQIFYDLTLLASRQIQNIFIPNEIDAGQPTEESKYCGVCLPAKWTHHNCKSTDCQISGDHLFKADDVN